jgi:hypothetical protein
MFCLINSFFVDFKFLIRHFEFQGLLLLLIYRWIQGHHHELLSLRVVAREQKVVKVIQRLQGNITSRIIVKRLKDNSQELFGILLNQLIIEVIQQSQRELQTVHIIIHHMTVSSTSDGIMVLKYSERVLSVELYLLHCFGLIW